MTHEQLYKIIRNKRSFLCIGLDTDINKIPTHLLNSEDPVFEFNKAIIDATHDLAVAYKPNIAFYESLGSKGWESLGKTVDHIRKTTKEIFIIADAKRGDIGNTSAMYAKTFFEAYDFDAITVAPYMGQDSVSPFLAFDGKWSIILALTSNPGAFDFQFIEDRTSGKKLFETVLTTASSWSSKDQMMFVVGATKAEAEEVKAKLEAAGASVELK